MRGRWTPVLLWISAAVWAATTQFGHRSYAEAAAEELTVAGTYRGTREVQLRAAAAAAWRDMVQTASKEGTSLIPISGFRSIAYQKGLFDRATKKYGSPQAAARWVAPPGYSEHATGWTLDVGDGGRPETDVETRFDRTPAFRWLDRRAGDFGFELSFPKDNPQGVAYEPWHWRYIGQEDARSLFHPALRKKL